MLKQTSHLRQELIILNVNTKQVDYPARTILVDELLPGNKSHVVVHTIVLSSQRINNSVTLLQIL